MREESIRREMDRRFPHRQLEYRNSVVATAIARGKGSKLTEDWLRRTLLGDVEDGFLTYGQAVAIKDDYYKGICEVRAMFEE